MTSCLAARWSAFTLLRYGMAVVLCFVGLKMVWLDAWYGGKFPSDSLAIIGAVLGASIVVSLAYPRRGAAALGGVRSEEVSR